MNIVTLLLVQPQDCSGPCIVNKAWTGVSVLVQKEMFGYPV